MDIDGTILVIGATGGIGTALTDGLAEGGVDMVLCARDADALAERGEATGARTAELDATDADAVEAVVGDIEDLAGAVNLAGSLLLKPAHRTSPEEFRATIDASLTTAFNVVRSVGGALRSARRAGSIVLTSSAVVRTGMRHHEAIAAAKGGVEGLTRAAAASYADRGIRINAVAPGMTETPLTADMLANDTSRKASESMHAMGTIAQPDDIASAIAWLLDPTQRVVTGQVLAVDAGLGSVRGR